MRPLGTASPGTVEGFEPANVSAGREGTTRRRGVRCAAVLPNADRYAAFCERLIADRFSPNQLALLSDALSDCGLCIAYEVRATSNFTG